MKDFLQGVDAALRTLGLITGGIIGIIGMFRVSTYDVAVATLFVVLSTSRGL